MTGTHNPRRRCHHAEIRRGAIFGDEFRSLERVVLNGGSAYGDATFDRFFGFGTGGDGQIRYSPIPLSYGSVTVGFSATAGGILIGNADLVVGSPSDGWCIWGDEDGVHANHSDGSLIGDQCDVGGNFVNGAPHVLTYTIYQSGIHILFVDDLAAGAPTPCSGPFGAGEDLRIGGIDDPGFAGWIHSVRIFDSPLQDSEHALYARVIRS